MQRHRLTLLSLFFLSLTVLMIELCLTRIFSVLSWHHFAYLIISLALLGFGAAGSYMTVSGRFGDGRINCSRLGWFAWLFAVTLIVSIILVTKIRFYPTDIVTHRDYSNAVSLVILYIIISVPFFFAGVCIGRMVSMAAERINLFYFVDLVGAGAGALLALAVINTIGALSGVFLGACFAALAACLLGWRDTKRRRLLYLGTFLFAVVFVVLSTSTRILPLYYPPSKDLFRCEHKVDYSKWHVVGKIDITYPEAGYWSFGGSLSRRYTDEPLVVRGIYQDGAAPTGIISLQEPAEQVRIFGEYLQGVPYVVGPARSVLVIGVGGGIDALIAMHYGAERVLGVDLNPVICQAVQERFRDECPALWADGRFDIVVNEGRHYLGRTREKFDVIQLSGVDTYTALSSGAYVLSENFLYTTEAMYDYWRHLTADGILSFSRWLFEPPRETLRLVTTQLRMLEEQGVEKRWRHFVVLSGPAYYNRPPWAEVLLKRTAFTKEQVDRLRHWAGQRQFDMLYDPYEERANSFDEFIRAEAKQQAAMLADYRFNVTPTTDDDPFFFQFYRWRSLYEWAGGRKGLTGSKGGYSMTRIPLGFIVLAVSLFQMVVLSLVCIIAPLYCSGRLRRHHTCRFGVFLYFAALGLGFIFIEITLLQKFSVFVGGPVNSMAVTLAAILVFSGIGSFLAGAFRKRPGRYLFVVFVMLAVLAGGEMVFLNKILYHLMGLSLHLRWLAAVLAIAPLALVMGMPFPTGLRILQEIDESVRPWAWGVNSFSTVIGSILCVLLSIHTGFTNCMLIAVAIYFVGGIGILWAVRSHRRLVVAE